MRQNALVTAVAVEDGVVLSRVEVCVSVDGGLCLWKVLLRRWGGVNGGVERVLGSVL